MLCRGCERKVLVRKGKKEKKITSYLLVRLGMCWEAGGPVEGMGLLVHVSLAMSFCGAGSVGKKENASGGKKQLSESNKDCKNGQRLAEHSY